MGVLLRAVACDLGVKQARYSQRATPRLAGAGASSICPSGPSTSLKEHRTRQAAERLHAGSAWQDHGLVFCREDGTPLDRWQVRRDFAGITKGRRTGGGVDTTGATALVRVHPQRPRRPHRGHQRPGGPQRHDGHRDRLPSRDQACAHHRRHRHGQDPLQGRNPSPAPSGRACHSPAASNLGPDSTPRHPPGNARQAATPKARLADTPATNMWPRWSGRWAGGPTGARRRSWCQRSRPSRPRRPGGSRSGLWRRPSRGELPGLVACGQPGHRGAAGHGRQITCSQRLWRGAAHSRQGPRTDTLMGLPSVGALAT